jgi:hypothetical protein
MGKSRCVNLSSPQKRETDEKEKRFDKARKRSTNNVKYEDWCKALGKNPNNDENFISWSEMRNNR